MIDDAPSSPTPPVLVPGRNCWRREPAGRVAFLVDGDAYFDAAARAMSRARRSILLLGWDVDSRVRIHRGSLEGLPQELGPFLDALARRRPSLEIRILSWDFAVVFALEREKLPTVALGWSTHHRVALHLDDRHPLGASHHQKVLVVDDGAAFAGGLDLTRQRWDTPRHDPADARRRDHSAEDGYPPFHDVQALVDGRAARALGDLARDRWRRATGERLDPPARGLRLRGTAADPWPPGLAHDLSDVEVGIARTLPPLAEGDEDVREVERLYLDEIAAARRSLYMENQYFTSSAVGDALEARLREPGGPEIVVVLPSTSSGWLEESTMGQLRSRLVRRLREADGEDRLRIVYPGGPARSAARVNVHSKVLICDDRHVRVGSSNTSNRSMSLDTECDLAIDAPDAAAERGIARFRARLLGEHLALPVADVEARLAADPSLVRLVDACAGRDAALVPLESPEPPWLAAVGPAIELVDPTRPPPRRPERAPAQRPRHRAARLVAAGLVLAALMAAWRFTPLQDHLDPQELAGRVRALADHPGAGVAVVLAQALLGLVAFPVTLMILVTVLAFGPAEGSAYALAGSLANAALGYLVGRWMGEGVRDWLVDRFATAASVALRHGTSSVAMLRLVPVAPFTVVNLLAGAARVRFREYLLGTVLGMAPGIVATAIFSDRLVRAVRDPGWGSALGVLVTLGAIVAGSAWLRRRAARAGAGGPRRAVRDGLARRGAMGDPA